MKRLSLIFETMALAVVVFLVASAMMPTSGFADTYNFFFDQPKKKGGPKAVEEPKSEAEKEEPEAQEAKPKRESDEVSVPAGKGAAPIVIQNYNTMNAPMASNADTGTQTATSLGTSLATPQDPYRRWRFGVSGLYSRDKDIAKDFFSFDPGPAYIENTYGGVISTAFLVSPLFAANAFLNGHYAKRANKTMIGLGLEAELYPFASTELKAPAIFEWGFLGGLSTQFYTDNRMGALHIGSRLNINFSSSFGLTAVARLTTDSKQFEAGFINRF